MSEDADKLLIDSFPPAMQQVMDSSTFPTFEDPYAPDDQKYVNSMIKRINIANKRYPDSGIKSVKSGTSIKNDDLRQQILNFMKWAGISGKSADGTDFYDKKQTQLWQLRTLTKDTQRNGDPNGLLPYVYSYLDGYGVTSAEDANKVGSLKLNDDQWEFYKKYKAVEKKLEGSYKLQDVYGNFESSGINMKKEEFEALYKAKLKEKGLNRTTIKSGDQVQIKNGKPIFYFAGSRDNPYLYNSSTVVAEPHAVKGHPGTVTTSTLSGTQYYQVAPKTDVPLVPAVVPYKEPSSSSGRTSNSNTAESRRSTTIPADITLYSPNVIKQYQEEYDSLTEEILENSDNVLSKYNYTSLPAILEKIEDPAAPEIMVNQPSDEYIIDVNAINITNNISAAKEFWDEIYKNSLDYFKYFNQFTLNYKDDGTPYYTLLLPEIKPQGINVDYNYTCELTIRGDNSQNDIYL